MMTSAVRLDGGQVELTVRDDIAVLTVDNPPVNVIGHRVRQGLADGLERVRAASELRGVVIACAGRTWMSGADVSEFGRPRPEPTIRQVAAVLDDLDKPVVAALFGTVFGGGFELAMACGARVAHPRTRVGLPEVSLGIVPGCGGTQRLPRLIGVAAAFDAMLTARSFDAETALAKGAIDALNDDPVTAAVDLARALADRGERPRVRDLPVPTDDLPADFLVQAETRIRRSHRGQFAPTRLIACFEALLTLSFDEAMAVEQAEILACFDRPQAAALRHIFFAERAALKLEDGALADPRPVKSVGILGAGTMGTGIAVNVADAGLDLKLFDADPAALERGMARIRDTYRGLVAKGRLSQAAADERQGRITLVGSLAGLEESDLFIEAVFEDMEVKTAVLTDLDAVARPGAVLATNTSYLSIDRLADATRRPEDVVGLHFFSPANIMRLCEVVRGPRTSPQTLATALAVAKRLGKVAVISGDADGFIGNHMLQAYRREAMLIALQGTDVATIDRALVDWGFAMGPFQVSDLAGLDIGYRNRRRKAEVDRDPVDGWVPDRLVEAGDLGRKSGRGFYDYGGTAPVPSAVAQALVEESAAALGIARRAESSDTIVHRCLTALANAGQGLLERGVAARASDIDLVYVHGYGFPAYRGGPMYWAEQERLNG